MTDFDKVCDVRKKVKTLDCDIDLIGGGTVRISERFMNVIDAQPEHKIAAHIFSDGVLVLKDETTGIGLCLNKKYYTVVSDTKKHPATI